MSRFRDYIKEEDTRVRNGVNVLDFEGKTILQYRMSTGGTRPGFNSEIGSYSLLRKIKGVIKNNKYGGGQKTVSSELGRMNKNNMVLFTDQTDIRTNDKFVYDGVSYLAKAYDNNPIGLTEVIVEKVE